MAELFHSKEKRPKMAQKLAKKRERQSDRQGACRQSDRQSNRGLQICGQREVVRIWAEN